MKRDFLVTGTLMAAGMLTVTSGAIVAPSLLAIADYFGGDGNSASAANLFLVMPSIGIIATAPLTGWAADRFGRWQTLAGSVLALIISGASGYWTTQYGLLLGERFLLGCSIAGATTSATSLLGALPEESRRQSLLGKQSAFTNLAGMTYLFLGGVLAAIHWRLPFLLYLWPLALLPFIVLSLRAQPVVRVIKTAAPQGNFTAFLRGPAMPTVLLVWILGCVAMMFIYTLFTVHPYRMQELGVDDARLVSFTIMIATASSAVAGWNLRRFSRWLSPYAIFALTFLLFGMGFLIIGMAGQLWHVLGGNLILGIGMGLPIPNGAAWLSGIAPDILRSRVLGIFNTFVFAGQFLSPLLLQAWGFFTPHIYHANLALGIVCVLITCLMWGSARYSRSVSLKATG